MTQYMYMHIVHRVERLAPLIASVYLLWPISMDTSTCLSNENIC